MLNERKTFLFSQKKKKLSKSVQKKLQKCNLIDSTILWFLYWKSNCTKNTNASKRLHNFSYAC